VNEHGDRLREAFETHEHLAPDPAAVYARVQELARKYQRRRRGAQVAGTAALSAGLIAGVTQIPGLLPHPGSNVAVVSPGAPSPSALSDADQKRGWEAYFSAGYDYDDALELARLWHSTADVGTIKAEAGLKLLAGETLPIKPAPKPIENGSVDAGLKDGAMQDAFFASGYNYNDAVQLARLWKLPDASAAKTEGGRQLLAGKKLPIEPSGDTGLTAAQLQTQLRVDAFFARGYDYNDAVTLGKLWKTGTPYDAKVLGGEKLLAGETLPIKP
jgi:hypothetical protein